MKYKDPQYQKNYRKRPEVKKKYVGYYKEYYEKNKDKLLSYKKKYDKEHLEWRENYNKRYYKNNSEKYRESKLKRVYGITLEEYNQMFQQQGGCCAICGNPSIKRMLDIDHNHKTGKVRGLLCSGCNFAVGVFENRKEDIEKYLRGE